MSKDVGSRPPSTRMNGTFPTLRCRSLAPRSTAYRSSSLISILKGASAGPQVHLSAA